MMRSTSVIALLFLATAHFSVATGIRGAPRSVSHGRLLKSKINLDCQNYDPIANPPPGPCPTGQTATYDLLVCEWVCRQHPSNWVPPTPKPQQPIITPPFEPPIPEVEEPNESIMCPEGQVPILNFQTKEYNCVIPDILCPTGTNFFYDTLQQTFYCVPTPEQYSTQPPNRGLRGVPQGVNNERQLKSKINLDCQDYDPIANPPPGPCPTGHSATYDLQNCEWVCKQSPTNWVPPQSQKPDEPISCPEGQVPILNFQTKEYNCATPNILCPAGTNIFYDAVRQTFNCVAAAAPETYTTVTQSTVGGQSRSANTASISRASGSQCNASQTQKPSNCPANYAAFFNHWNCSWICKPLNPGEVPAETVAPVLDCKDDTVLFWNNEAGRYQCVNTTQCAEGQYVMYNSASQYYYCRNI